MRNYLPSVLRTHMPLIAALFVTALPATAQTGRIAGLVRNAETGEVLGNVSVAVRGTTIGAKSLSNGSLNIANVPTGRQHLVATGIGFQAAERDVTVTDGGTTGVTFDMIPRDIEFGGVTVSSPRDRSYVSILTSAGTKTSTPLRDIPASIQVIPELVLKDQGAASVDQTIRNVSGIVQSSQSNYGFFNNYTVRGLRQRFLRDGVPDGPTTNGYARSLTDVDHIEVLKGPGSALYGSSEPGGSINLVSKPVYEAPTLVVSQSAGSFNSLRTALDAGGAIVPGTLRSRVSADYSTKEGYRGIGNTTFEVLPMLVYSPSDNHTLTLNIDYRKVDQEADPYGTPFRGTQLLDVSPEFDYHTPFATTTQKMVRGSLAHLWRVGEPATVRTYLTFMKRDLYLLRNSGGAIAPNSDTMSARALREQTDNVTDLLAQIEPIFKTRTGSMDHTILTGMEYSRSRILTHRQTAALPSILNVFAPVARETSRDSLTFKVDNDRDITLNQLGIYAQDQIAISSQFKVRGGMRYDIYGANDIHHTDTLGNNRTDEKLSGQIGLVFQPLTELSLYGGAAHGSLSTVSTESARISEPEQSTQYELGSRTSLLDGLVQLNIAAFFVTREHFNVTVGTEQIPVGKQRTQGIEVDMSGQPTESWGITGNLAYYDAKITNNPADTGAVGKRPIGVPETSGSLWSTYAFKSGFAEGFGFGAGLTYRDAMYLDAHNTRSIDAYVTLDGTLFYRTRLVELQINLTNIGNMVYYRNGVNSGALPGDPRSIQGSIRLNLW
ncbi:MAG: TonB-dependent receptor [Bacteroidetes bacterium]|nr:TonB-dependent receptor [Bacteroidota bacterium]